MDREIHLSCKSSTVMAADKKLGCELNLSSKSWWMDGEHARSRAPSGIQGKGMLLSQKPQGFARTILLRVSFLSLSVLSPCPQPPSLASSLVLPLLVTSLHSPHLSILVVFRFSLREYSFASSPPRLSLSLFFCKISTHITLKISRPDTRLLSLIANGLTWYS